MTMPTEIKDSAFASAKELLLNAMGPACADHIQKLDEEFFRYLWSDLKPAFGANQQEALFGVVNGGDMSTNTLSIQVNGSIPELFRTIGQPVNLTSEML